MNDGWESRTIPAKMVRSVGNADNGSIGVEMKSGDMTQHNDAQDDITMPDDQSRSLTPDDIPLWREGKIVFESYRILETLGRGGIGIVNLVEYLPTHERYAMKSILPFRSHDEGIIRNFYKELRIWINLPPHPNLTECLFCRTFNEYLVIFAEFVDGGSLRDWIATRRVLSLKDILDVSIQVAWGLEFSHQHGVVHGDVKPGNILMTRNGIAKLTDFGLADMLFEIQETISDNGDSTTSQTAVGMTLGYCSPEQSRREKLDHRSDIWSYGIIILDMFKGSPSCRFGFRAQDALRVYCSEESHHPIPEMPQSIIDVLFTCFQENPDDRWQSFDEISCALQSIYLTEIGEVYPRKKPVMLQSTYSKWNVFERKTVSPAQWEPPMQWIKRAAAALGRNPLEAGNLISYQIGTRKSQILVDLEIYDIAQRMYLDALPRITEIRLSIEFATFLQQRALLHEQLSDFQGALESYDKSIQILQILNPDQSPDDIDLLLANALLNKAVVINMQGRYHLALDFFEMVVRQLNARRDDDTHSMLMASALINKGICLSKLQLGETAIPYYNDAIERMEGLFHGPDPHLEVTLAVFYLNRAIAEHQLQQFEASDQDYNRSIQLLESSSDQRLSSERQHILSAIHLNRGVFSAETGNYLEAIRHFDKGTELLEKLYETEQRVDIINDLSRLYMNKGVSFRYLGDLDKSIAFYDKAISLRQPLICRKGHDELLDELPKLYINRAQIRMDLGEWQQAITDLKDAVFILEFLIHTKERSDLIEMLARGISLLAMAYRSLDDTQNSIDSYNKAISLFFRLIQRDDRVELTSELAKVKARLAETLMKIGNLDYAQQEALGAIHILETVIRENGRPNLLFTLNWIKKLIHDINDRLHSQEQNP